MAKQCPICLGEFGTKVALKAHTGTKDPALRKAHMCSKCDKSFCSQRAMEQHREAQAHNTMFSCDVCPSKFGSKQAMANHRKSPGHKRMVDRAELAARSSVGVISCVGNTLIVSDTPAIPPFPVLDYTDHSGTPDAAYYSDEGAWACDSHGMQDDDQDWALCDKDCGWCGHCADSVHY